MCIKKNVIFIIKYFMTFYIFFTIIFSKIVHFRFDSVIGYMEHGDRTRLLYIIVDKEEKKVVTAYPVSDINIQYYECKILCQIFFFL